MNEMLNPAAAGLGNRSFAQSSFLLFSKEHLSDCFAHLKRVNKRLLFLALFAKEQMSNRSFFVLSKEQSLFRSFKKSDKKSDRSFALSKRAKTKFFAQKKERSLIFKMSKCPTLIPGNPTVGIMLLLGVPLSRIMLLLRVPLSRNMLLQGVPLSRIMLLLGVPLSRIMLLLGVPLSRNMLLLGVRLIGSMLRILKSFVLKKERRCMKPFSGSSFNSSVLCLLPAPLVIEVSHFYRFLQLSVGVVGVVGNTDWAWGGWGNVCTLWPARTSTARS